MDIPGYSYIAHKIVPRSSGDECRFTVVRDSDGFEISDTVAAQADDAQLVATISAFLARMEVSTHQPDITQQVSFVDTELEAIKERVKLAGCAYIKHFPACTEEEFLQSFSSALPDSEARMAQALTSLHITGAYLRGLIPDATFTSFRNFVAQTPVDLLMSM